MNIGENLKRLREKRHIDLQDLADMLQKDQSYLEEIEANKIEPLISELLKLARILNTDISALIYGNEFYEKKAIITRVHERITVNRRYDIKYESLAPNYAGRHMEPFLIELDSPRHQAPVYSQHNGEEFHYVLSGKAGVVVDGKEYELATGDSIYFDSSLPHAIFAIKKPAKLLTTIYDSSSMLHLTRGPYMRDLIHAAKHLGGKNIAVICPERAELETINKGIEEGIIRKAFLIGAKAFLPLDLLIYHKYYEIVELNADTKNYHQLAAGKGTELIRNRECQLLMKGLINTVDFIKAVLNKETGITISRRLSLISICELPNIQRPVLLTDPGINPALVVDNDLQSAVDIIKNAIETAQALGVVKPKVALLEANEKPSQNLPATLHEQELTALEWEGATVFGPLSYDLALYEESARKKGLTGNPVAGKADILVVPYVSAGNFLYKAWVMTMNAEVASVVVGAQVPLILTSRSDSPATKFLTLCASTVLSSQQKIV
jgi:phosphate butyryltransferase